MLNQDERIDDLNFTGTKIIQSDNVFSFSTDAILLSKFAKIPQKGCIVDLCAGNGAVGLILTTRTKAQIHLIELQEKLADMAQRSVILNKLEKQVITHQLDLKQALSVIPHDSVDAITCNPPYFTNKQTNKQNPNEHLALARHEITTNLAEICQISNQLLKTKGHFNLVHRPERFLEIMTTLQTYNLIPKKIQFIYPKPGKDANLILIDAIKNGQPEGLKFLEPLYIYNENNQYTKELLQIYHA